MTILGVYGEDKSGKTSLALTAPKPLAYIEFDIGGFDRAKHRFKDDIASDNIIRVYKNANHKFPLTYVTPPQGADIDLVKMSVRPSKIIIGIKELWYRFLVQYLILLDDPRIATIVIDTGTLLWEVCTKGYLQEKQEIQFDGRGNLLPDERLRVILQQIEYGEPNLRQRGLIYNAKVKGKHLVLTHHARDQYKPQLVKGEVVSAPTGKRERSGWGQLGDSADMIVQTYMKPVPLPKEQVVRGGPKVRYIPYCKVELAEVPPLIDMEFEDPTFDKLMAVVRMIRGEA